MLPVVVAVVTSFSKYVALLELVKSRMSLQITYAKGMAFTCREDNYLIATENYRADSGSKPSFLSSVPGRAWECGWGQTLNQLARMEEKT
jgi:hypothetical protein